MSEVKVNKISPRSGTTVTLGDSGDTFTIPSGATINNQGTATNFGATGSASWVTTVKTSGFTAVAGEGYFVDTTSGAISINLPAGTAGAVVAIKDYAGTFQTNKVTLVQNGSDKIGGSTVNGDLETEGIAVTLVFVDSTQGWLVTDDGTQSEVSTTKYVTATGGTVTCSGNCKVHTFTGPGTFTVTCVGNAGGSNKISYMVIAGGGGGAYEGGGAAGGYREGKDSFVSYTASPLACTSGANAGLTLPATGYPITVGAGGGGVTGPGGPTPNNPGANSVFSTITSAGGGAGANSPNFVADPGGSGGGGASGGGIQAAGNGNTPPVSPPQGNNGGAYAPSSPYNQGGGGGGAGGVGNVPHTSGGGIATTTSIPGSSTPLAGGGGGGGDNGSHGSNGHGNPGGGGGGGGRNGNGVAGTANTGGGGGGSWNNTGGNGGSGIVVIRYKFQG